MKFCQSILVTYPPEIWKRENRSQWRLPWCGTLLCWRPQKVYKFDVTPSIPVAWAYCTFSTQSSVRFSHFTSVNVSRFYKILVKRQYRSNKVSYRLQLQYYMLIYQFWEDYKLFYDKQTVESYLIDFQVRAGKESVADPEICFKCVCPTLSSYFESDILVLLFYPRRQFTCGINLLILRRWQRYIKWCRNDNSG
jgi:hypothetical protein